MFTIRLRICSHRRASNVADSRSESAPTRGASRPPLGSVADSRSESAPTRSASRQPLGVVVLYPISRRQWLSRSACGFGALALAGLNADAPLAHARGSDP